MELTDSQNTLNHLKSMDPATMLDVLLNATNEAIVFINKVGQVEMLSQSYAEFLGVDKDAVLGRHITDVIENTRMHIVLETGKPEFAQMQMIDGQNMIATRIPIFKDGEVVGAFGRVLFKNLKELEVLYSRINHIEMELNLYKNKFNKSNQSIYDKDDIVTLNDTMLQLKETIRKVSATNSSVLILGESGTGKELFAHSIHSSSKRSAHPFVSLNCGTIPSELLESELFGYEDGAFTGARRGGKIGLFKAADQGTIFLDEIAEMPVSLQAKLLRTLQEKEIRKVGASVSEKIDVRIIAATNQNLYEMVEQGRFRSDLYYRLNVININIPPLRERKDDIPVLANYLIQKVSQKESITVSKISAETMEYLKQYDWPGNVRELENVLESAINFLGGSQVVRPEHLPVRLTGRHLDPVQQDLKSVVEDAERQAILSALAACENNRSLVAKALGISRTSLYEKMKKLDILFE